MMILSTVHGSHLYGLAHAGSDRDRWEVYADNRRTRQTIRGDEDVTRTSLGQFLRLFEKSAPLALEAAFSKEAVIADGWEPFFKNLRISQRTMIFSYRDFAHRFLSFDAEHGSLKHRRHALRILENLETGLRYGRFDPTLDSDTAARLTAEAEDIERFPSLFEERLASASSAF